AVGGDQWAGQAGGEKKRGGEERKQAGGFHVKPVQLSGSRSSSGNSRRPAPHGLARAHHYLHIYAYRRIGNKMAGRIVFPPARARGIEIGRQADWLHRQMARKTPRPLSDDALDLIARRFAVLAEPMRLRLIHALFAGEQNVTALVELTGGTQANV